MRLKLTALFLINTLRDYYEYQNLICRRNQTKKNSYDIPPVLFANPKNLYQRRAKRLRELAKDHPLADYLLFAADVVESQLSVFEKIH